MGSTTMIAGFTTDAIVAIGCGLNIDGSMTPQTMANIKRAVKVFKENRVKKPYLILSGGNGIWCSTEAGAMKEYAIENGAPANLILLDAKSRNTRQNAEECLKIAREHHIGALEIISCAPHSKCVRVCFLKILKNPDQIVFLELPEQAYSSSAVQRRSRSKIRFRLWTILTFVYYSLFF